MLRGMDTTTVTAYLSDLSDAEWAQLQPYVIVKRKAGHLMR